MCLEPRYIAILSTGLWMKVIILTLISILTIECSTEDEFYLIPGTLDRPPNDEYKGIWRLAVKDDPKAHLLFMRFANTGKSL